MKRHGVLVVAIVVAVLSAVPFGAKAGWVVDTSALTATNAELGWKLTFENFNSASPNIKKIETLAGCSDVTTLDLSGLYGANIGAKGPLTGFCAWTANGYPTSLTKLILPTETISKIQFEQIKTLMDVRTHSESAPHTFSIANFGKKAFGDSILDGSFTGDDWVFTNVETIDPSNGGTFYGRKGLEKVRIEGSFGALGPSMFAACYALKSIELVTTGTITSIPNSFCQSWDNSTPMALESVTLNGQPLLENENIASVGAKSFLRCVNLPGKVILPSCTSIGQGAFQRCALLAELSIPSIATIAADAFNVCTNLHGGLNSEALTTIGGSAFAECSSFDGEIKAINLVSLGSGAFMNTKICGLLNFPKLEVVDYRAFKGCKCIEGIADLSSLTKVGQEAFYQCSGMKGLGYFPSLTQIVGGDAFDASGLSTVIAPKLSTLFDSAFRAMTNLQVLDLPLVTDTKDYLGYMSSAVREVNLPSVTVVGQRAFENMYYLERVVFGGETITVKGQKPFSAAFQKLPSGSYVLWNNKSTPIFASTGDYTFMNAMNNWANTSSRVPVTSYVRKEAGWKSLNDASHKAVVQQDGDAWYIRQASGNVIGQSLLKEMDTVWTVNMHNGDTLIHKTMYPGIVGEGDLVCRIDASNVLPADWTFIQLKTTTGGCTVKIVDKGAAIVVTLPAANVVSVAGVTQDVLSDIDIQVGPRKTAAGLVLIIR